MSSCDERAWEQVIRSALGQPGRQTRPGVVITRTPAQVLANPLKLFRLGGQPPGDFLQQHQGQAQLLGQMGGHRDGGRGRFR